MLFTGIAHHGIEYVSPATPGIFTEGIKMSGTCGNTMAVDRRQPGPCSEELDLFERRGRGQSFFSRATIPFLGIAFATLGWWWFIPGSSESVFIWVVGLFVLFVVVRHIAENMLDWFVINEFPPFY